MADLVAVGTARPDHEAHPERRLERRGAVYAWEGSGKAGAGRMEIMEAPVPSKDRPSSTSSSPSKRHNFADFTLVPRGDATDVTWVMRGPSPFVSKLMGLFVGIDTMIGKDFEAGLANLKAAAEK